MFTYHFFAGTAEKLLISPVDIYENKIVGFSFFVRDDSLTDINDRHIVYHTSETGEQFILAYLLLALLPVETESHDEDDDHGAEKSGDADHSQLVPFIEIGRTLVIDCIPGIEVAVGIV